MTLTLPRWAALLIVTAALLVHALVPRYRITHLTGLHIMRTDRWTGDVRLCSAGLGDWEFTCGGRAVTVLPPPTIREP
jgi:hypothetical protein